MRMAGGRRPTGRSSLTSWDCERGGVKCCFLVLGEPSSHREATSPCKPGLCRVQASSLGRRRRMAHSPSWQMSPWQQLAACSCARGHRGPFRQPGLPPSLSPERQLRAMPSSSGWNWGYTPPRTAGDIFETCPPAGAWTGCPAQHQPLAGRWRGWRTSALGLERRPSGEPQCRHFLLCSWSPGPTGEGLEDTSPTCQQLGPSHQQGLGGGKPGGLSAPIPTPLHRPQLLRSSFPSRTRLSCRSPAQPHPAPPPGAAIQGLASGLGARPTWDQGLGWKAREA